MTDFDKIPERTIDVDINSFGVESVDNSKVTDSTETNKSLVDQHNASIQAQKIEEENKLEGEISDLEEEDEILEPLVMARRWVIGKPPEHGGKATEYEVYYQRPLGFMARNRFIALVTKTMSTAIRATGGDIGGMNDVFGEGEGSILDRGKRLREHDFKDASSFFALAMELIGYAPEFLSECYALFLDVPNNRDRGWFKEVIDRRYDPENNHWGLSEEAGIEMIELFIHQNYEDMRRFFLEKLPKVAKRISQIEKTRVKKLGESLPSK
jgi:hypothetical protein